MNNREMARHVLDELRVRIKSPAYNDHAAYVYILSCFDRRTNAVTQGAE